jgi:hypothetical protein
MMKKRFGHSFVLFALALAFMLIALSSAVSAQYFGFDLRQGSEQIIQWVIDIFEPFLQVLLGGQDYTGLLLFERLLVFILLMSVIYVAIRNVSVFEDNKAIAVLVSVIIPLVSIRYIDFFWFNTILVSYQVLGIAIAGVFPFIIYLFFVHKVSDSSVVRKICWVFFIMIYFGLWTTNQSDAYTTIYFWTMLVALILLISDGTIHRYFVEQRFKESGRGGIYKRISEIDKDIRNIESSTLPEPIKKKQIRGFENEKKRLYKSLSRV